jgi:protease II
LPTEWSRVSWKFHVLGQPQDKDRLIYEEKDELYRLSVRRTRDRACYIASSRSSTTTEERMAPGDRPDGPWLVILPRETSVEYHVGHRGGVLYILTNNLPSRSAWSGAIPTSKSSMIKEYIE